MPLGTSLSQMVTVAMLGPILSQVSVAAAFAPHPAGDTGVPTRSSLLSLPVGEDAVLEGPPPVEGTLVSYRLPEGPLEWSSCDEGGSARFMLNDSREDKVWQYVYRQGLEAQEVLASTKRCIALVLKEVERAEKLVTSGLHPAVGVRFLHRVCSVLTPFRFPGVGKYHKKEIIFLAGGIWS